MLPTQPPPFLVLLVQNCHWHTCDPDTTNHWRIPLPPNSQWYLGFANQVELLVRLDLAHRLQIANLWFKLWLRPALWLHLQFYANTKKNPVKAGHNIRPFQCRVTIHNLFSCRLRPTVITILSLKYMHSSIWCFQVFRGTRCTTHKWDCLNTSFVGSIDWTWLCGRCADDGNQHRSVESGVALPVYISWGCRVLTGSSLFPVWSIIRSLYSCLEFPV